MWMVLSGGDAQSHMKMEHDRDLWTPGEGPMALCKQSGALRAMKASQ